MAEAEIQFTGWRQGPTTVPRAIFEVGDDTGRAFVVSFEVPESVRARIATTEQGDDEPDEAFVERLQTALRSHGEEVVRTIVDDPERSRAAHEEGHLTHEVDDHEFQRLLAHLSGAGR